MDVSQEAVPTWDHGRKSAITTAVQLVAAATPCKKGVWIKAAIGNTVDVYIGKSDVTLDTADATDGFPIAPGEAFFFEVDDVFTLFARAASSSKVFFFWF